MSSRELFQAIGAVDPALVEAAERAKGAKGRFKLIRTGWIAAACFMLVAGIVAVRLVTQYERESFTGASMNEDTAGFSAAAPEAAMFAEDFELEAESAAGLDGASSFSEYGQRFVEPMGMRKFLNYNGYRYAFVDDGAVFDLNLGMELGILEHDILFGIEHDDHTIMMLDLATSFALGGTLFEIEGYDSRFRIAAEHNGEIYMAELTGLANGLQLAAKYYVDASNLYSAESVFVYNHLGGGEYVAAINDISRLVDIISLAIPAVLDEERYIEIAYAQSDGRSQRLEFILEDSTTVTMLIIPDLNLITIGDGYYLLDDDFTSVFESLLG